MYAHIDIWRSSEGGTAWDDAAGPEIADVLRDQPGFRSYTLVRSPEGEVVSVMVFESKSVLERATAVVERLVRERVRPSASDPPERRAGFVLDHLCRSETPRRQPRSRRPGRTALVPTSGGPDVELVQARHAGVPRRRRT